MNTVFLRVLEAEDKSSALLEAIAAPQRASGRVRFELDPKAFQSVPRSPFAYWVSDRLRGVFEELPPFEGEGRTVKQGLATADDGRFVRTWWEVPEDKTGNHWFAFAKGGRFSPFYADVRVVVNWNANGREVRAFNGVPMDSTAAPIRNPGWYFRPGLTWPLRGVRFSAQAVPRECVFSVGGKMAFTEPNDMLLYLALFNSRAFDGFIAFFAGKIGGVQYEVGLVQSVPVPSAEGDCASDLAKLAHNGWSVRRSLDTRTETSHAFVLPALLTVMSSDLAARVASHCDEVREAQEELRSIEAEIDEQCFALYGIAESDRAAISGAMGPTTVDSSIGGGEAEHVGEHVETLEEADTRVDATTLTAQLASWAAGVAFGRFDIRLATGERETPPEPEPFDSLPACSPGMLTGADGLPAPDVPDGYPLGWPRDGVLVDDPGHPEDIVARVRDVFDIVFGEVADSWWQECAQLLGGDLRRWLARSFFEAHLKSYSKSRRKAPIYWQLATPTGRYTVWLYAHRAGADTLYRVLNDFATPKLQFEERRLTGLVQEAGSSPSPSQRRDIETQRAFVEELRAFRAEVARVAPLWRPDLDDGVLITCAPLWRLVPQHRAWQRETKACWAKLVKGEFDWAHLAMHLWPERVVPKCAKDRSLAIAHGLEDAFWIEGDDGKWTPREVDDATVERLVQERSSAAVKAALADLLAAG